MLDIPSYIFGGENTEVKTPEDLARKRALVDAMMSQQIGSQTPRNLGEGLGAIGKALMVRQARKGLEGDVANVQYGQEALSPIIEAAMANQQSSQELPMPSQPTPQPDMTQAQPIPQPINSNMPPALSGGQQTPVDQSPQMPQGAASGQLAALMSVVNDPRFAFASPIKQKMVMDQIQTIQAQQDPMKQIQLETAQVNLDNAKDPNQEQWTDRNTGDLYSFDPRNPKSTMQLIQKAGEKPVDTTSMDEAKQIGDAIINGDQPPEMTGLYKQSSHVRAYLAKNGYDLTHAKEDWQAQQRYLSTLNGPQQVRLRQAIDFSFHSLPIIKGLAQEWKAGLYPALNYASLESAKQGALGQDAQRIATQLSSQIADMTSELGTVYKGGNGSTDESLKLAAENLKANWSEATLLAGIDLVGKNLTIRRNSLASGGPLGVAGQYNQNVAPPVQAAPPTVNGAIPEGWTQEEWDVLTPEEKAQAGGQ